MNYLMSNETLVNMTNGSCQIINNASYFQLETWQIILFAIMVASFCVIFFIAFTSVMDN